MNVIYLSFKYLFIRPSLTNELFLLFLGGNCFIICNPNNMRPKRQNRKTLLLIDDDKNIYLSLKMIFPREDYEIIYAPSCAAGIERLKKGTKIDLIILDIVMPTVSGITCLDDLKEVAKRIPIVILSALDRAEACAQALKKGAKDYVTKPFDVEDLKRRINAVLFPRVPHKREEPR
jgi:DNA-binding response OmpR family regulator